MRKVTRFRIYFETELVGSLEVIYKSNRGINNDSEVTFAAVWIRVAGNMELLVADMVMKAETHGNTPK